MKSVMVAHAGYSKHSKRHRKEHCHEIVHPGVYSEFETGLAYISKPYFFLKILRNWDNKKPLNGKVKRHGEIGMIRREDKTCKHHIEVREVLWLQIIPTLPIPLSHISDF